MKKRLVSWLIVLTLLINISPLAMAAGLNIQVDGDGAVTNTVSEGEEAIYSTDWYFTDSNFTNDGTVIIEESGHLLCANFTNSETGILNVSGTLTVDTLDNSGTINVYSGAVITFGTFTEDGEVVTAVSYQIGETGTATLVTANEDGTYTITATENGTLTITVETDAYVTITFNSGDHATFTSGGDANETVTAYAIKGGSGLYSSLDEIASGYSSFTMPTPILDDNYRLDPAYWSADIEDIADQTWANIYHTMTFTQDVTFTVVAIETVDIIYTTDENAMFLGGDTTKTYAVDKDTEILSSQVPIVMVDTGYEYAWDTDPLGKKATAATTYNVTTSLINYTVTFSGGDYVTYPENTTANYGTDFTFTQTAIQSNDFAVTGVNVTVAGKSVTPTENVDGTYTIAGSDITGNINITPITTATSTVTFMVGENGSFGEDVTVTSFVIDNGTRITSEQLASLGITADEGYEFVRWVLVTTVDGEEVEGTTSISPTGMTIFSDTTFKAIFKNSSYTVTASEFTNVAGVATHGTDFIFTPKITKGIITDIEITIGGDEYMDYTMENGAYIIDGADIVGDIVITLVSSVELTQSCTFITDSVYKILDDEKVMILYTAQLKNNGTYSVDGTDMFWSDEYEAYIGIVPSYVTSTNLGQYLAVSDNDVQYINNNGDVNGNGEVTITDAARLNAYLSDLSISRSYKEILEADVNANGYVSVADIYEIHYVINAENSDKSL